MKKLNLLSLMLAFLFVATLSLVSCGGGETKTNETDTEKTETEKPEVKLDLTAGKTIYEGKCQACHQANGQGLGDNFPPLAKSDFLKDKTATIKSIINGISGEIEVNGKKYSMPMAAVVLTDQEAMDVVNYILNSWENKYGSVTLEDIKAAR